MKKQNVQTGLEARKMRMNMTCAVRKFVFSVGYEHAARVSMYYYGGTLSLHVLRFNQSIPGIP